ncbi:MAG: CBS domain-containing protein [Candidatus Nitrosotalea sp.]|nr:CBS domain-containing protein [Candidatus Nitrosotalea sp.]
MNVFVKDIMKKQIVSMDSSLKAKDAATLMTDSGVSCLVIIEKNVPIGMLTERDFVTKISTLGKYSSTSIREIMSMPLITISPDATVTKLTELMSEKKIHKVPVV